MNASSIRFPLGIAIATGAFLMGGSAFAQDTGGRERAAADSVRVEDALHAESAVDSLRAQIQRLEREIQALKREVADGAGVDRLLAALTGEPVETDAPEDTRARRQRVDSLLRAITQRPGQLRFNGGATSVIQGEVAGETDEAAGTGSIDIYASTSFGSETLLFLAFEVGGGTGLDETLPLATAVNGDAVSTRGAEDFDQLALREAWAEFSALDQSLTFSVGKLDLTNYFDINPVANDETAQFLSGAFVNSAALQVPSPGPGVRVRTVLFRRFSVQGGVTSADSTGGTRFEDPFLIGSVGVRPFPDSRHDGNLRAYLYAPSDVGGATGWGLSFDQGFTETLTLFGRVGRNDSGLLTDGGVRDAWSAGIQWAGKVGGRNIHSAAAWGEARTASGDLETNVEIYTSLQLNTWTFVSPHFQWVRNVGALDAPATLLSMRVQINF